MKLRQRLLPFLLLTLLSPLAALADRAADERACCESCDTTGYFPGFSDNNTWFRFLEIRDWDCCLMPYSNGVVEGGIGWLVDGHYKWRANGDCTATIVESTGIYASIYPVNTTVALSVAYATAYGSAVSNTYISFGTYSPCCNSGGNREYGILSDQVFP